MKDLERENATLKRLLADAELEKEAVAAPVSRMTLLRMVRAVPEPTTTDVTTVPVTVLPYAAGTSTARC